VISVMYWRAFEIWNLHGDEDSGRDLHPSLPWRWRQQGHPKSLYPTTTTWSITIQRISIQN